jgi:exosortase
MATTNAAVSKTKASPVGAAENQLHASEPSLVLASLVAAFAVFAWAYWTTLTVMVRKWSIDPQYSHGYLVPLISLYVLWARREHLDSKRLGPSWWGVPVLLAGLGLRLFGAHFYFEWFDALSILPVLAGICLLVGGVQAFRWAWVGIAFLVFMVPLPFTLETALRDPLKSIATAGSTFVLQTTGIPAIAEGHTIVVNDHRMEVEEACSGLSMLMVFFALSTAVAILSERALWERIVIVLSAVPIALLANVGRITLTGMFYVAGWDDFAKQFHDNAALFMMPFAGALLFLELGVLNRLFIVEDIRPMDVGLEAASSFDRPLTT